MVKRYCATAKTKNDSGRNTSGERIVNRELHNFVKVYITLLQEKYTQYLRKAEKSETEADAAFARGAIFTYYDALDLLKSQLEAFGYDLESSELIVPELGKPIEKFIVNSSYNSND